MSVKMSQSRDDELCWRTATPIPDGIETLIQQELDKSLVSYEYTKDSHSGMIRYVDPKIIKRIKKILEMVI
ncbi:MAG: hypothetical protein WCP01_03795 [Methylococcaceae bacterium]